MSSFFSLHTCQISLQLFGRLLGQLNGTFMFQFIKSASLKKHEIPCWLFIRSLVATPLASLLALVSSRLGAYLSCVPGHYGFLEKMKVQRRRCFVMPKPSSANCTTKAQRKPWSTARWYQRFREHRKAWIHSLQLKMHCIFTSSERTIRHSYGRELLNPVLCCRTQRDMDGTVKMISWSLRLQPNNR